MATNIKRWTEEDKQWLLDHYWVDISNGTVYSISQETGERTKYTPQRINPKPKQYLAVTAKIGGKWTKVRLHHLCWFIATGEQSLKMIDHIVNNQDTEWGNRYDNLRQCTAKQNRANITRKGYRVVRDKAGQVIGYRPCMQYKHSKTGKTIYKYGKVTSTPEAATAIHERWQRKHHRQFAACTLNVA